MMGGLCPRDNEDDGRISLNNSNYRMLQSFECGLLLCDWNRVERNYFCSTLQ